MRQEVHVGRRSSAETAVVEVVKGWQKT